MHTVVDRRSCEGKVWKASKRLYGACQWSTVWSMYVRPPHRVHCFQLEASFELQLYRNCIVQAIEQATAIWATESYGKKNPFRSYIMGHVWFDGILSTSLFSLCRTLASILLHNPLLIYLIRRSSRVYKYFVNSQLWLITPSFIWK